MLRTRCMDEECLSGLTGTSIAATSRRVGRAADLFIFLPIFKLVCIYFMAFQGTFTATADSSGRMEMSILATGTR